MVKTIHINVSYNKQNHIFECDQRDFLEKAAEYYNIDMRNFELYSVKKGQRHKILPPEITDLMKIEIVRKSAVTLMGNQRTMNSYLDDGCLPANSVDSIITKLTNNTSLTGKERKSLVHWLRSYSTAISKKRKLDIAHPVVGPVVSHRKVQVNITNCKNSFTQTDLINTPPEEVQVRDGQILDRIKRLAMHSDVNREEVAALMRDSFDERRNFIVLKTPAVRAVKDKYPLLFCLDEVKNELSRIFYADKCNEFINNMHRYALLIMKKYEHPAEDLSCKTKHAIEHAHTEVQKQYARVVGSIFILTKLMEEDFNFIHLEDYAHGSEDVYPYIDASLYSLKKVFRDECLFNIIVEGQHLCEARNLLEAILCLIGCFFIFNIDYPESCRRTMIVFEKLYLDANDTVDLDDHTMQMVKLLQLEAKTEN